jgi:tetratricopeptide (TPR) repeat protein
MGLNTFHTAVQLARQGARDRAYRLLSQMLRTQPRYAPAWLWLSGLVDDPERQRECLERALALDPRCEAAQLGLTMLRRQALRDAPAVINGAGVHWKIGAYLVKYGFVSQEQFTQALEEQHTRRHTLSDAPMVGNILVARGWITPHGLATALMLQQQDALSGPHPRQPQRLGEFLVAEGFLTIEQMAIVLAKQIELQQRGVSVQLGALVVRERYVNAAVIEQLLARQRAQRSLDQAA